MDRKKKSSHQLRKDGLQIGSQTLISTSTSGRCGCSMVQCHVNYPAICTVDSGKCQVSKISLPCDSGVGNDYSTEDSHGKHQEGDRVEPSWQKLPRTDSLGKISGRSQMESFPECQGCQCWLSGCCMMLHQLRGSIVEALTCRAKLALLLSRIAGIASWQILAGVAAERGREQGAQQHDSLAQISSTQAS